ncbi:MAG TPA: hypothetical protein ENJ09_11215 [Planctomycetes bacterium]|nr:hypothetical protein [Planctomycetota bacterium]
MSPGVEISKKLVLINSASTLVRRALSITVLFWMHQYLLKRIPIEEYALLPVLMGVIAFTPLLSTLLAGGLGRYMTEAYARHDERRVTEICSTMTPLLVGAALLLACCGALFTWKIDAVLDIAPDQVENARRLFTLLLIGAVVRVAVAPFLLGFYIRQKLVQRDLIGFGVELVRIAILFVLLTQFEARILWVVVASLTANLLEMGIVFVRSRALLPALRFRMAAMRRDVLGPVLSYGSWTILGQLSWMLREMMDPIILNKMAGPSDVATFSLGSQVDRQLRRTLAGATAVTQQAATAMVATDQGERLRGTWLRLSRYSLWTLLGAAAPLVVYRVEFFQLYLGEALAKTPKAPVVLAILLSRYLVLFPNAGTGILTMAKAEMRPAALRGIALELSNLALTLVLVGVFSMGSVGSALATTIVCAVGHPLLLWPLGLRFSGASLSLWWRTSIRPGLVPMLVALPVWLAIHVWLAPTTIVGLGVAFGAGWVAYSIGLFFSLRPEDRRDFAAALSRVRVRLRS